MSAHTRLAALTRAALIALALVPAAAQAAEKRVDLPLKPGRANFGDIYRPASVALDGGIVTVTGLIRNSSMDVMAVLPAGMRPQRHMILNLNINDGTARVDVYPNGDIRMNAGSTALGWISLDGLTFPVKEGPALQLAGGWRNYGEGFTEANATLVGDTVYLGGMVVPGSGNTITTLPQGMRPAKALIFNVNAFNTTGRVDVYPSGEVTSTFRVPGAKWVSLNGIAFERKAGQPLTLAGGWSVYGQQFAPPTVKQTGNRITVSGLARASSGSWGHIATLPKGMCPETRLIFNQNNHERTSRIDVLNDCRIVWIAGGHDHGWLPLDGISFDLIPSSSSGGGTQSVSRENQDQKSMLDSAYNLIKSLNVPALPEKWNDLRDRFDFEKDGKLAKIDITLFNQKATLVIYRPKGKTGLLDPVNVAVLIGNVKISNLIAQAANTVADDLQINNATYIYVPKGNEEFIDTSDLPQPVRGFVEQVRTGPIDILSGQNMFAQVDTRDGGETAKFLKQINVPLDHLKVNASYGWRKSRETGKSDPYQAVRLTRPGWWDKAFYLNSVQMKDPTFEYAKHGNVKVFRGWGTAKIYQKEYFMFTQKTGTVGPFPTAVSLDTESITLRDYIQLSTLFSTTLFSNIPAFQNLASRTNHLSSVLDRVKIKHTGYNRGQAVDKDNNPVFDNVLLMAASSVDELPDGKQTKGAAMVAHGAGEIFGLNAARVDAEIYKSPDKATELDVTGRVTLPSNSTLRLGGFDFRLFKDENNFAAQFNGDAKLAWNNQTIFSKQISFDANNSGLRFKFPATCPVQLWDWNIQAGFDLRSASNFQILPAQGCSAIDMLVNFLKAGQKLVSLGGALTEQIGADVWRGLRDLGGGKINANTVTNAVKQYGNPANAAKKLADAGEKAAKKAVSTVTSLIKKGGGDHPEPIYRDDPSDCKKGQYWSLEYGACWTPGSELIRLKSRPDMCISVRHRIREKAKGIEIWKCEGDWHQQWRRAQSGRHESGIRDGLDGKGFCWEHDEPNRSTESRECQDFKEPRQQYYRDAKDRLIIKARPKGMAVVLEPVNGKFVERPYCLTAETPVVDGSDLQMQFCEDNNPNQVWLFDSKDSFK
tara:strand:+ start:8480 stop:11788 length:3309 start_codon:yes stop_codon:yes gene_type:complete